MKSSAFGKKKSSSSSRSKNYYGYPGATKRTADYIQPTGYGKQKKDINDPNNSSMSNYKGGKFLRGRKYSFSPHVKDK
jgi:lysozyme family protein